MLLRPFSHSKYMRILFRESQGVNHAKWLAEEQIGFKQNGVATK